MDVKKQSLSGVIWTLAEKFGSRVLTLLIFLILARLLGAKDFGMVAIVSSIMGLLRVLSEQGFSAALVQKPKLDKADLDTSFWGSLGINIFMIILLVSTSGLIADYYEAPQLQALISVLAFDLLLFTFSVVQRALFQRNLNFRAIALGQIIGTFSGGIAGIIAAFMGFGPWSLVIYMLFSGVVVNLVFWVQSTYRIGLNFSWERYKTLFSFGINVMGSKLLFYGNNEFINLLIGSFLGLEGVGYFHIASKVYSTFKDLLINALGRVALPIFSKLQEDWVQLRRTFISFAGKMNLLIFPVCFAMAIAAQDIVNVFGEEEYADSVIPMSWLMGSAGFLVLASYVNDLLLAIDKPSTSFRANLLSTFLNFLTFAIFVSFGLNYVAFGFFLRNFLMAIIAPFFLPQAFRQDLNIIFIDLLKAIGAGMLVLIPLYFWPDIPTDNIYYYASLAGKVVVSALIMGITLRFLDPGMLRTFANIIKAPMMKLKAAK
ncbi:MAG: lipopolysaccharide biosynthesis protein [Bacteroidota bacterium]